MALWNHDLVGVEEFDVRAERLAPRSTSRTTAARRLGCHGQGQTKPVRAAFVARYLVSRRSANGRNPPNCDIALRIPNV